MGDDSLILREDGYIRMNFPVTSLTYHSNLNIILVKTDVGGVHVLDVNSGVILQSSCLSAGKSDAITPQTMDFVINHRLMVLNPQVGLSICQYFVWAVILRWPTLFVWQFTINNSYDTGLFCGFLDEKGTLGVEYAAGADRVFVWDGSGVGARTDYNGVLLLHTALQRPLPSSQADKSIKVELVLSEVCFTSQPKLETCMPWVPNA